jgi:hypothetical protein
MGKLECNAKMYRNSQVIRLPYIDEANIDEKGDSLETGTDY